MTEKFIKWERLVVFPVLRIPKKKTYKEKLEYGQGLDLEPKSSYEIKSQDSKNYLSNQFDEETRLNGGRNTQYFKADNHLGSLSEYDDMDDESAP